MVDLQQWDGAMGMPQQVREPDPVVTSRRLGEVWPQVAQRLTRMLYLRGLDRSQADDVVQDVALRALSCEVPFDGPDDLYAWAASVARHLHIDLVRAGGRTTDGDTLAGLAAATDVEYEVERRMTLESTLRAIATLGAADRAAIIGGVADGGRADPGRVAVRRYRARQRLRVMLKGALGWTFLHHWKRPERGAPVLVSAAAMAPVLLVTVLPGGQGGVRLDVRGPVAMAPSSGRPLGGELRLSDTPVAAAALRPQQREAAPRLTAPPREPDGKREPIEPIVSVSRHDTEVETHWETNPANYLSCVGVDPVVPRRCVVADLPPVGDVTAALPTRPPH